MALVAVAMLLSLAVRAQDLGVIGPVYPIAEPSLLEVILARLRDAEASGVLARLQRDAQARAKHQIEQPAAIVKLTKTTKARSFYYDPSIVVPYAILDADGNPSTPICYCNNPPRVGVTIGFWEPVRLVDVTRTPFCMVALGGIAIDPGIEVPRGAQVGHDSQTRNSFYHVHWYTNPILYWLEVLLDFPCLEQGALDLVYLTEVDPLWADDELTAILNPEAVLFANAPAKAACAADCVASTAGLGIASLFWCAGCQGSIYPMSGHVAAHIGGVQASALLTQRMTAKMHRQLATYDGAGAAGLCGYYMQPIMDKTHYKLQMVYPVPNTQKDAGQCCQPYGRTTMIWGAGKSFPVTGEDFSYQIFRKRNCCAGAY